MHLLCLCPGAWTALVWLWHSLGSRKLACAYYASRTVFVNALWYAQFVFFWFLFRVASLCRMLNVALCQSMTDSEKTWKGWLPVS